MKHGFSKGIAVGASLGILLASTSAYAATKLVQAELVRASVQASGKPLGAQTALKYKGSYYLNLQAVESVLHKSGVTYSWKGSTLNVGASSKTSGTTRTSHSNATGLTFTNLICQNDGMGDAEVDGIAVNHDKVTHTAMLIVSFYDKNGKLLGTGDGAIDSLGGGKSVAFTTMSQVSYSSVASFKVQVSTMIQ